MKEKNRKSKQEFSFGHVKFEIPVIHESGDMRIGSWNIGVWKRIEKVWVECKFGSCLHVDYI